MNQAPSSSAGAPRWACAAPAWAVACLLATSLAAFPAGCTNVVNGGTVLPASLAADAATDAASPVDSSLTLEQLCTKTSGTIEMRTCCATTEDFAPLCWFESCACQTSSQPTRTARLCICPLGDCFRPTLPGEGCLGVRGTDAGPSDRG